MNHGERAFHIVTIIKRGWPWRRRWDVFCHDCDFTVLNLSSEEAATDTMDWHLGFPSHIGGELP